MINDKVKDVRYRLNPILTIPGIVKDCLDGYAAIDQAIEAIRKILAETIKEG